MNIECPKQYYVLRFKIYFSISQKVQTTFKWSSALKLSVQGYSFTAGSAETGSHVVIQGKLPKVLITRDMQNKERKYGIMKSQLNQKMTRKEEKGTRTSRSNTISETTLDEHTD